MVQTKDQYVFIHKVLLFGLASVLIGHSRATQAILDLVKRILAAARDVQAQMSAPAGNLVCFVVHPLS